MADKEYLVRPMGKGYEVAVFSDHKWPEGVYYVQGLYCSCPAGGGDISHKHIELVRLFHRMGEPAGFVFWRDETRWHAKDLIGERNARVDLYSLDISPALAGRRSYRR